MLALLVFNPLRGSRYLHFPIGYDGLESSKRTSHTDLIRYVEFLATTVCRLRSEIGKVEQNIRVDESGCKSNLDQIFPVVYCPLFTHRQTHNPK